MKKNNYIFIYKNIYQNIKIVSKYPFFKKFIFNKQQ